jgi:hypothetical protein
MKVNKVFPYKYSYNNLLELLICHDNSLMTRTSPIIIVIALWSFLYSDVPLCQLDPELTTAPSLKRKY